MAYGEKGNEGEEVHVQRQPGFWLVTKSVCVCVVCVPDIFNISQHCWVHV